MKKRLFGRALLVVFIGLTLGGCASMAEFCSQDAKRDAEMASAPAVAQPAPPRQPEPARPVPPPKKDRN